MVSEKLKRIYKAIMLIILTATITFIITSVVMYNKFQGITASKFIAVDGTGRAFQTLRKYVDENYLYEADEKKMLEYALQGYIYGLEDAYSEYVPADEMNDYIEETTGKFVGIGIYMMNDTKTNQIVILAPIEGSPAEEVGIKPGDIIKKIDGVEYFGETLDAASSALKKEAGTKVEVEVLRNEDTMTFEIERREVKINPIKSAVLEDNIGYIKINSFDDGSYDDFVGNWAELKNKNVKALIIDLRDNGGGIVKEALDIADLMVEKDKTLLITTSKNKGEEVSKSKRDKEIDIPVVILINEGSASSSEILAVAVRDNNKNATLVGQRTYGKGVIQTIFTLSDGSGLKLTTNEYFSPNNVSINKAGIYPNVKVDLPEGANIYSLESDTDTQLQKAIEVLKAKI